MLVIFFSFPSTMSRPGVQRKCVRPVLWAQDAFDGAPRKEKRVVLSRLQVSNINFKCTYYPHIVFY